MRRTGRLFEQICQRDNLREAFAKSVRGKKFSADASEFSQSLEENLNRLAKGLALAKLTVGQFHQFVIHDPKMRIITAPCFSERVLHHAIMNICEPIFERNLISDTYACRQEKGRLKGLQRAFEFTHRSEAYLQLDIRKYFDSISHELLIARLRRLFREPRLIDLFVQIIASFRSELGVGLPIGALTSQHLANNYLSQFDRFVKEELRVKSYVRYMDDMILWGESPRHLRDVAVQCRTFLQEQLRLTLKSETQINWTRHGLNFLGCRLFPTHITLNRRSKIRFQRKLKKLESGLLEGTYSEDEAQQRGEAMLSFTMAGDVKSWRWRNHVLQKSVVDDQMA